MPPSRAAESRTDRAPRVAGSRASSVAKVDRDPRDYDLGGGTAGGVPGRRTITIRGQVADRNRPLASAAARRRPERRYERAGFRPDRTAMWAVLLGVLLILAAAASAHGAPLH